MGCCTSPHCPCKYAKWLPRLAFGLVLVAYGVNHYRHFADFSGLAKSVYATSPAALVPVLSGIAGVLAYIVPGLMIVGGVLFALKQLPCIAKTCVLASLAGIIGWAGAAVLFGDGATSGNMMPLIQNAAVLLILYYMVKKNSCGPCGGACACGAGGACKCGMPK